MQSFDLSKPILFTEDTAKNRLEELTKRLLQPEDVGTSKEQMKPLWPILFKLPSYQGGGNPPPLVAEMYTLVEYTRVDGFGNVRCELAEWFVEYKGWWFFLAEAQQQCWVRGMYPSFSGLWGLLPPSIA